MLMEYEGLRRKEGTLRRESERLQAADEAAQAEYEAAVIRRAELDASGEGWQPEVEPPRKRWSPRLAEEARHAFTAANSLQEQIRERIRQVTAERAEELEAERARLIAKAEPLRLELEEVQRRYDAARREIDAVPRPDFSLNGRATSSAQHPSGRRRGVRV
jgi:chromosome segregation ATPase